VLGALGLSSLEEAAYRRLVGVPSTSAESLADAEGVRVPEVLAALASLEEKGLVARSTATPGDYVASPPALAVGSMIVERRDEIRRAELELERLVAEYRGAASDRASTEVVDVVHGEQAVAQRFAQLQRGAAHEVLALVKSTVALVPAEDNVDEQVAVSRGVTYRVVVERSAMEKPGFLDMVAESVEAGERVRVTDRLPLRLLIADRSVALLPLAPTSEDSGAGALVIHPSGLLDALLLLFDMVWASARELLPATGLAAQPTDGIDELDARLLTLLLAGLTDQAIAGQLGISARTVQRRVSALMARAQVSTRFALGHEAARRGWFGV
jgi:sugar-specific transcriptional regulator TrmB/DNA-binding CsgD family transcriptional regulator